MLHLFKNLNYVSLFRSARLSKRLFVLEEAEAPLSGLQGERENFELDSVNTNEKHIILWFCFFVQKIILWILFMIAFAFCICILNPGGANRGGEGAEEEDSSVLTISSKKSQGIQNVAKGTTSLLNRSQLVS